MSDKTDVEVLIGGKVITLSGAESEEYLQKVAAYLNTKLSQSKKMEGFQRLSSDLQSILLQINIADDYFKMKDALEEAQQRVTEKEKELYDLKHELIATQIKLENTKKEAETGKEGAAL